MSEGLIIAGRYQLLSQLGKGGMGSVYRGVHLELGTPVAVKLIHPGAEIAKTAAGRFRREARAAASIRSSHVVQILDYGVDANIPYIVMELLEGESLASLLERDGMLAPQYVAHILGQVGKALERAHALNIVHRDLKPANIFLSHEGSEVVAKVLDFGIAKTLSEPHAASTVETQSGAILGTAHYMSPEQATGRREVDHRADIWALGVIAFECITGIRPFRGATLGGLMVAICSDPLPRPSDYATVPAGFDAWFAKATERTVDQRYSTMADAVAELRAICAGTPPIGGKKGAGGSSCREYERHTQGTFAGDLGGTTVVASSQTIGSARSSRFRLAWALGAIPLLALGAFAVAEYRSRARDNATPLANSSTPQVLSAGVILTATSATSSNPNAIATSIQVPNPKQATTETVVLPSAKVDSETSSASVVRGVTKPRKGMQNSKPLAEPPSNHAKVEVAPAAAAPVTNSNIDSTQQNPEDRLAF